MASRKSIIRVISRTEMPASEQAAFNHAVEGLLAELIRTIDRPSEGDFHDLEQEEQVARLAGHRGRPPKQ